MKASALRKKISMKYAEGIVNTDDGEQVMRFPLLTTGDWGEFKDTTGVDVWDLLLSVSAGSEGAAVANMSPEELEEHQKQTSINLLKKIDQKNQIVMIYLSLRRDDEDVAMDDVDYIVSYGMEQSEYIKIVNFLLYGVTSEQVKKMQEVGELKNATKAQKAKPGATTEEK